MLKRTKPLRRTPLRKVSAKRQRENRVYAVKRKAFLEARPYCEVRLAEHQILQSDVHEDGTALLMIRGLWRWAPIPRATDIHHVRGRTGTNFLDESTWMAVSREGHMHIHNHPSEARAKGWLL